MNKTVNIIGIGMNVRNSLTREATTAIEKAQVLIGAQRMIESFSEFDKIICVSYNSYDIVYIIKKYTYNNFAVLMSGDCGFYSSAGELRKLLSSYCDISIICGISSPIYFSSKIGIPWQNWHFVSLHDAYKNIVRNICANEKTFFLLGGNFTADKLCRNICEYGLSDVKIYIGENLSYQNERIINGKAKTLTDIKTDNLCVLLAINENYEKVHKIGICDSEFIRGNAPMTKSEIRAVCISKLEIGKKSTCWDIGAGTGSVSVEMAIHCIDGTVYAVDKSYDMIVLIDRNKRKFGCDNIISIFENAENAVEKLPAPDCVFIGGSDGSIKKIINTAYHKNPHVQIVITAISLETLNKSLSVFNSLNICTEISQVSVTHTKKIGNYTMLNAENPIFIIKGLAHEPYNDCRNK